MKRRIISLLTLVIMLLTVLIPSTASAYIQHDHVHTNGCVIWYQWTVDPYSVQLGYKQPGETYAFNKKIPADVIEASLSQIAKRFSRDNYSEGAYFNNNLYKSGLTGLPYYQSETSYGEPLWAVCTDIVKVYLRDYLGYNLGYNGSIWDDDALFDNFADGHSLPGYLAQHTHGSHEAHLIPTLDDTGNSYGFWEPKYTTVSAFQQYLISEENAGRLHKGAIFFWSSTRDMLFSGGQVIDSDQIHHVSIYLGGGKVLESTPTTGISVNNAAPGSAYGKSGMCKFWINIDEPAKPKTGSIKIKKVSSSPDVTTGNPCYSLEGATFKLTKTDDSSVQYILTTDSKGEASQGNIPIGSYTLVETGAPKGFEISTTTYNITIEGNVTTSQTISEIPKNDPAGIRIYKKDKETGAPSASHDYGTLEGAVYEIRYFTDASIAATWSTTGWTRRWYLKTDADGFASFSASYLDSSRTSDAFYTNENGVPCIPLGTVIIKEVSAPNGYLLSDEVFGPYHITENSYIDTVYNGHDPDAGLLAKEQHERTAQIKVYKKGPVFDHIDVSTSHGKEVKTPVFTEQYLAGVKFQIVAAEDIKDSNGNLIAAAGNMPYDNAYIVTTSEGPVSSKELPFGKYTLKEIETPAGYMPIDDITIEIVDDGSEGVVVKEVNVGNEFQNTEFNISKVAESIVVDEETGNVTISTGPKAGFVFGIFANENIKYPSGEVAINKDDAVYVGVTDSNGKIKASGTFPIADYYIQEIEAPEARYIIDNTKYPVSNKNASTESQLISLNATDEPLVNEYDKAWAQIVKIDAETNKIIKASGFKFDIFDAEGNKVDYVETDENGIAKLRMPLEHHKTYTVKETKAADGYTINNDPFELIIEDQYLEKIGDYEERYTVRFSDTRVKGRIEVEKKGEMITSVDEETVDEFTVKHPVLTTEYLSGVTFRITAREDIVYNGEIMYHAGDTVRDIVTNNGKAVLDNMYLGKYTIKEIDAPDGYVLEPNEENIDLLYKGQNVKVVTVNKSFGNDLRSVTVTMEKHAEVYSVVTDSDGNVNIVYDYVAGEGFMFGLYNKEDIINVNTNEVVIPADSLIGISISDASGLIKFTGKYPTGHYYVKEIKTLPKYQVNHDFIYNFEMTVNDKTIPSLEFNLDEPIINNYEYAHVKVTKTDITGGEGLPGATLEVRDEEGTVIYRNVTGEDGALEEIKLIPGTYTLHEIFAPNGYALSEEIVTFTVNEDGTVEGETTMKDDVTRFSFYKIDESGRTLSGAEFTMYDENGNVYAVSESDENGVVTFEKMLIGKYIIKETKALPDYQLSSETVELDVTDQWLNSNSYTDGGELMYSIMNYQIITTGRDLSVGAKIAIGAGSLSLAALLFIGLWLLKKKRIAVK